MSSTDIIVGGLDLETTGLIEGKEGETPHRIIEVGIVLASFNTGKTLGSFVRRFNPGRPIDPKAQAVHGIGLKDVAHLPRLEDDDQAISIIQRCLLKADVMVMHNGKGFDQPFLAREFARIGKPLPVYPLIDTMLDARWATPLGKVPNLGELCFACRVPYDPDQAHGALYDVEVMLACYRHAAQRGFFKIPMKRGTF